MRKQIFLLTASLMLLITAVAAPVHEARAQQEIGSLSYYDVPKSEYYDDSTGQYKPEYYQWKLFLEYNLHREQCQHYQDPPAGYVVKGCQVYRLSQPVAAAAALSTVTPAAGGPPAPATPAPAPEKSYPPITVYFDFDKYNIRESEEGKIDQIADEIKSAQLDNVVIAGHTDTAGPFDYNMKLSQRRAQTVADALIAKGVSKDIIQQKAYGKTDLAVPTADNVPLQANRRGVVIFVTE